MVSNSTTGSSSAGGGLYNSGVGNALTLVNTTVSGNRNGATSNGGADRRACRLRSNHLHLHLMNIGL